MSSSGSPSGKKKSIRDTENVGIEQNASSTLPAEKRSLNRIDDIETLSSRSKRETHRYSKTFYSILKNPQCAKKSNFCLEHFAKSE